VVVWLWLDQYWGDVKEPSTVGLQGIVPPAIREKNEGLGIREGKTGPLLVSYVGKMVTGGPTQQEGAERSKGENCEVHPYNLCAPKRKSAPYSQERALSSMGRKPDPEWNENQST